MLCLNKAIRIKKYLTNCDARVYINNDVIFKAYKERNSRMAKKNWSDLC